MTSTVNVLNLDKYKESFKTPEEFKRFMLEFGRVVEGDMGLVVHDDKLLAALFPAEEAQKRLQEQIVKRFATDPALLETLQKRLESDDLVP